MDGKNSWLHRTKSKWLLTKKSCFSLMWNALGQVGNEFLLFDNLVLILYLLMLQLALHLCIVHVRIAVMWFEVLCSCVLGGSIESDNAVYCDRCYRSVVCMCVSSVTLVHPAKAVGLNEMPFGRETRAVSGKTVLDRGPGHPTRRGDLGSEPLVRSDAAYRHITLVLVTVITVLLFVCACACMSVFCLFSLIRALMLWNKSRDRFQWERLGTAFTKLFWQQISRFNRPV